MAYRKIIILNLVVLLALVCIPFEGVATAASANSNMELVVAVPSLYDEVPFPFAGPFMNKVYQTVMYDNLVNSDAEGNLDPETSVAYKWEEAADQLSWTFYIRDGIKFQNGDPLGPEDVKFTLEQGASKDNISSIAYQMRGYLKRVQVVPPNKVVIHLKKAWPFLPYYVSGRIGSQGMIVPKKYFEDNGKEHFIRHPVTSGPYKWSEHKDGSYIKFEAVNYPHWRVGKPRFKTITFRLVREEETRVAMLKTGEADIVALSRSRSPMLEKDGFNIHSKKAGFMGAVGMLRQWKPNNPLGKLKVRKALAYAINKDEIMEHILYGRGTAVGAFPNFFSFDPGYKHYQPYPYDPDRARKLLAEAGHPNGFTIYLYSYPSALAEQKLLNQAVAGYWEGIGMDVRILEMDYSAFGLVWSNKKEPPGPATHIFPFSNRSFYGWRSGWTAKGKYTSTKDPEMGKLVANMETQSSLEDYIKALRAAFQYAYDNCLKIGLYEADELFASNDKIKVGEWQIGKDTNSLKLDSVFREKK